MTICDSIKYAGVDDHQIDLFEGQFEVPNGMAYNSYVIISDKIAVMDSVDAHFGQEWLSNIEKILAEAGGRKPDYLIVQHMEMDHSANIKVFADKYPDTKLVRYTHLKNPYQIVSYCFDFFVLVSRDLTNIISQVQ